MAEQSSGDTRGPAAPRRGARPFIGPAGSQGQRPMPLRPPVSGVRPAGGPFVPAAPPPGHALGSPRRDPAAASVSQPDAVLPIPEPAGTDPLDAVFVAPAATPSDSPLIEAAAMSAAVDEVETPASPPEPSADDSAYETFAAFDVTWNDPSSAPPMPDTSTASPLDVSSLGNADGIEELWADDIAAEDHTSSRPDTSTPAWLMDDVAPPVGLEPTGAGTVETRADQHVSGDAGDAPVATSSAPLEELTLDSSGLTADGTWTEDAVIPSADTIVAGHTALEQGVQVDALTPDVPTAGPWPDQLLAEYAPYLPTPALPLRAVVEEPVVAAPIEAGAAATGDEAVAARVGAVEAGGEAIAARGDAIATAPIDETPERDAKTGAVDAPMADEVANGIRVSAMLNRLANRIREGEIDVSSIAPDAPDAAVLASVLAALLGGGGSGRR